MIRVLLDTDHVRLHERGHLPLRARLATCPPEEVAVSVVTRADESTAVGMGSLDGWLSSICGSSQQESNPADGAISYYVVYVD
jgi:hypothetical protein